MKSLFITLGTGILLLSNLHGQRTQSGIDNVHMDVSDNTVLIHFDINGGDRADLHDIRIQFISDAQELIQPYNLGGDIGPGITSGTGKTIVWDVTQDMYALHMKLYPLIISDRGLTSQKIGGGPGNAWLSLLVPGLGDYFVANRRDMKFKPIYRTLLALGCTSLGTYAALQREQGEPLYALSKDQASPHYNPYPSTPTYSYKFYGYGDTRYALFKGDAEVLLSAGVAVWLYDVIWVYSKGNLNRKLRLSMKANSLGMGPVSGGAQLSCTYTF